MLFTATLRRMVLAGALSTAVGGAATTTVPGLGHWPAGSVVLVVVVIAALGGILRKIVHTVVVAVAVTVALVVVDAVTGGHIQQALNLGALLHPGRVA